MAGKVNVGILFKLALGIAILFCFYQFVRLDGGKLERFATSKSLSTLSYPKAKRNLSAEAVRLVDQFNLESKQKKVDDGKITFVTATSDNHFGELLRSIGKFASVYPNETLLVYNLGLTPSAQHNLIEQFSFENYRVLWMDTSIHLLKPIPLHQFDGIRLFTSTGHSLFATTNPLMYDYFPTVDSHKLKQTGMFGSGFIAFMSEPTAKISVLRWWILCALDQDCMAPRGSQLYCKFPADWFNFYANCHRFDQSAINLILAHHHNFDTSKYVGNFSQLKGQGF